jgi:hypothetical protein
VVTPETNAQHSATPEKKIGVNASIMSFAARCADGKQPRDVEGMEGIEQSRKNGRDAGEGPWLRSILSKIKLEISSEVARCALDRL